MEKIKITIDSKEYTIKQSFRALMLFEEMTNKTVNQMNESAADILKLFYCILKGNNKDSFTYTFEQFLDLVDEQPEVFTQFTEYLQEQAKGQIEQTEEKKSKIEK
jgi:hypothetical protein